MAWAFHRILLIDDIGVWVGNKVIVNVWIIDVCRIYAFSYHITVHTVYYFIIYRYLVLGR